MITVKTSPNPSAKYGDTVCVAGIRTDREPYEWIRLYPVNFRWLSAEHQFKKYEIVTVNVKKRDGRDPRPESYTPDLDNLVRTGEVVKKWSERLEVVSKMPVDTMCDLIAAAKNDPQAKSLGLVKPRDVTLVFTDHAEWTADEINKMRQRMDTEINALIPSGNIPQILRRPRFKVSYRFKCDSSACIGHTSQILDWELSELQRRLEGLTDEKLKESIELKFLEQMFNKNRETLLFVGNLFNPMLRHNFSVLGVFYPESKDLAKASTLF